MIGTVGLGVSSEDKLPENDLVTFGPFRIGIVVLFLLFLTGAFAWGARLTATQKRRSVGGARTAASVYGLQVGATITLATCIVCLIQHSSTTVMYKVTLGGCPAV